MAKKKGYYVTIMGKKYGYLGIFKGQSILYVGKDEPLLFTKIGPITETNEKSKETIDFINNIKSKVKGLKKGQYFLLKSSKGPDEEVIFVKTEGRDKLVYMKEGDVEYIYNTSIYRIKKSLDKINKKIANDVNILTKFTDVSKTSLEELVKITLKNVRDTYEGSEKIREMYPDMDTEYEVLEFGDLVRGEAFDHETDEYIDIAGFFVKCKNRRIYKSKDFTEEIGFFPVYVKYSDSSYDCPPIIFTESYQNNFDNLYKIYDGLGNHFEVSEYIMKKDEVQRKLEELKINYKDSNIKIK